MKKLNKDPLMKTRIVISSIALAIFIIGWIIYGINVTRSNPSLILRKHLTNQEKIINNYINSNKFDLYSPHEYTINNTDDPVHIYMNLKNNELFIFNDTYYYDVTNYLNTKGININYKELNNSNISKIIASLKNTIINNTKIIDTQVLKDKKKNYYLYHYSLNELAPLISTLKTDKTFIETSKKILGTDNKKLDSLLDSISDKNFGISISTKSIKRDITNHSIKINGLLTINKDDNNINGFIGNHGFIYEKDFTIVDENKDYTIKEDKISFNKDNLSEGNFNDILEKINPKE